MPLLQKYAPSWSGFFTGEILRELERIEEKIGYNHTPCRENILRIFNTNLNKAKICIVGQDVYYQPGVATGRSFEVGGLTDWNTPFRQISLKNIVRLIHKNYNGIEDYRGINKFTEILMEINDGKFRILPPDNLFESLERQGVLFLKTYLTCEINRPNSHRHLWEGFAQKLFTYISEQKPDLIWFMWGNEALSKKRYIKQGTLYESRHPMMCSEKYDDDFLKSNCFKDTMNIVNWLG